MVAYRCVFCEYAFTLKQSALNNSSNSFLMKILIIKLGALGDIIFSTPVIKQIQEHHSNDNIWLLTTPAYKKLFNNWANLKVVSFERGSLIDFLKALIWVRKQGFDRVYDLQSNDRTGILCALSGIRFRIGNHPGFPYHSHPKTEFAGECHAFDRLNQIIESVGIKAAEPAPFLPISDDITSKVKHWLKNNGLQNRPFILLHAGSSRLHVDKRWPFFMELANRLGDQGFNIIWIGSDDDRELNASLSESCGIDATNQFNIHELIELGKQASFAITNDSAPMHLLSCSNIPVFGLFGPTNPRRTHALGQKSRVITVSNKMPENDKSFQPEPISKITPDKVIKRIANEGLLLNAVRQ